MIKQRREATNVVTKVSLFGDNFGNFVVLLKHPFTQETEFENK